MRNPEVASVRSQVSCCSVPECNSQPVPGLVPSVVRGDGEKLTKRVHRVAPHPTPELPEYEDNNNNEEDYA